MLPRFHQNPDAQLLLKVFMAMPEGAQKTYGDLSQILGRQVDGSSYSLISAKKQALRQGALIETIPGQGITRLTPQDTLKRAASDTTAIRRHVVRAGKRLATLDPERLTEAERHSFNARMTVIGILAHVAKPKSVERITASVEKSGSQLAIEQTLKAISEGTLS